MEKEKFVFFWESFSPFSQWHVKTFTVDGITFNTAEKWMMYQKAILFNDLNTANKILKTNSAKQQKALGREVVGFQDSVWKQHREKIVYDGNYHKFTQNLDILKMLLNTKGKVLVESSPYDKIWGIGLEKTDSRALDRKSWKGLNLLGEALTKLRDDLIDDNWENKIK